MSLQRLNERMTGLRKERYGFWQHWRLLADYILPRRYRWLVTPNEASKGIPINQKILDSTASKAAQICAAGMKAGIVGSSTPWFKLRLVGNGNEDGGSPENIWLAECERRMLMVFSESNFYNAMGTVFMDLVVFGSAANIIYEDFEDIIRCHNPCLGEFYFANGPRGNVETFGREFTMTLGQLRDEFGEDKIPAEIRDRIKSNAGAVSDDILVAHLIEPNRSGSGAPKLFRYVESYWIPGKGNEESPLRVQGFHEWPVLCPRWDVNGYEAYGRSPGMDALGDIRQLQQETKRKAQAIDKMVTPPMLADIQLRNQPASLLPGGVTYVAGLAQNVGMKPVYQVNPPVQELMMDIKEIQVRIRQIFFNDLFQMFQDLQAEPRSAAAVDARREEKLISLGPVLERFENEALDPAIDRLFGIMQRGKMLPPPPPGIGNGQHIRVAYVSMLAEAQRATATAGIERWAQFIGSLAGAVPQVLDIPDWDETTAEYATILGVAPKLIQTAKQVQAKRDAKQKQMQQQQVADQSMAAVQGAHTLSQTDVGGGQNALAAMLGGGGQ